MTFWTCVCVPAYVYIYKMIYAIIQLDGDIPNIIIHIIHMWQFIMSYTYYVSFGNNLYFIRIINCDNRVEKNIWKLKGFCFYNSSNLVVLSARVTVLRHLNHHFRRSVRWYRRYNYMWTRDAWHHVTWIKRCEKFGKKSRYGTCHTTLRLYTYCDYFLRTPLNIVTINTVFWLGNVLFIRNNMYRHLNR